jgi:hypothetical protein
VVCGCSEAKGTIPGASMARSMTFGATSRRDLIRCESCRYLGKPYSWVNFVCIRMLTGVCC